MAGYLFQPERALYWLAKSKNESVIGIEAEDDIVRKALEDNEINIYEQDKHSISNNIPFGDNSKDLWNTLGIWLEKIDEPGFDFENSQFHLVTNKIVMKGIVIEFKKLNTEDELILCVEKLRGIAKIAPISVKKYVDIVCSYSDEKICRMFSKIILCDGESNNHGESLKEELKSLLLIPQNVPFDEVYNSLLGWIHNTAINCWRKRLPAWISRQKFVVYHQNILSKYKNKRFIETNAESIILSENEKKEQYNEKFVQQLYLIAIDEEDDTLVDAIEDFLRCNYERTRISVVGDITAAEMKIFDENLLKRWKMIFLKFKRKYKTESLKADEIGELGENYGLEILAETMDHRENLAEQPTEQFYLTRGSYHKLANHKELKLGWHPEFEILLRKEE